MTTLGEVKLKYAMQLEKWELFGCTADAARQIKNEFAKVGSVFMQEMKVTPEDAVNLPDETVLGLKVEAAYEDFKKLTNSL